MPKIDLTDHHQPRRPDKKKHHRRGFTEDVQDKRAARISFKRYVQQLEEDELLDNDLLDEDTE